MNFKSLRCFLSILLCGFLLIATLIPAFCQEQSKQPAEVWQVYFNQAKSKQLVGDLSAAQKAYQAALDKGEHLQGKERIAFWMSLQDFYANQKDFEARQLLLEKILSVQSLDSSDPLDLAKINVLIGQNLMQLKSFDKAEEHFKLALKIQEEEYGTKNPGLNPILDHLAELYTLQNKTELTAAIIKQKAAILSYQDHCPDKEGKFQPYVAEIQKKIRAKWTPPILRSNSRTVVRFKVYKNGAIDHIRITTKSDDNETDLSAVKAVILSNPLPPLPLTCVESVFVEFIFDYERNKPKKKKTGFSRLSWLWEL